jgi:quinolinate synthase
VTDKDRKLMNEILKIKDKKSVYIIAHYYQRPEIQDIADFVGDSYAMAVQAQKAASDIILVAGVDFMAESAAILCPDKTVLSPEPEATCPMANSISVNDVLGFKEKYPESIIVSYVNTPADIKAVTDICCTSSNAHIILEKSLLPLLFCFAGEGWPHRVPLPLYFQQKLHNQGLLLPFYAFCQSLKGKEG